MVQRHVLWRYGDVDDELDVVECAVRADGTCPAKEFLDGLAAGQSELSTDALRDQVKDREAILAILEWIGARGEPPHLGAVNYLRDGIWEVKVGELRLTFWDTDDSGNFVAKEKAGAYAYDAIQRGSREYTWFPDMDPVIRVGNAWRKEGDLALDEDIERAIQIREEDCEHDRSTQA